jgi:PAS domain S-box-containing protein
MPLVNARVLLVEDNTELAENVIEILEEEHCHVIHASTGARARELAVAGFDVALIDVNLPDSTGLELLRELKASDDRVHEILLVTGNASIQNAIEAVKGGAYDYIIKPFRGSELIAAVVRAWRQVSSTREARALSEQVAVREEKLRTLVDTVQALLLVLDRQGCVVQANWATAALTGLRPDQLIGMQWVENFVHPADREAVEAVFLQLIAGESGVHHQNRLVREDGSRERLISWQSSSLVQPNGSMLFYTSGLDVTELRELESRTRLAERLAAVGTLSAGLAHEIRNPLNSARLQLHLLERRLRKQSEDAKLLEPIGLVQNEIERLSQLVQEFLDFARPSLLHLEDTDLYDVVSRVVELERHAASEHNVAIHLSSAAGSMLVTADRAKVQQVVLNLVRNAIEAVGEDGEVFVDVEYDGHRGLVRVRDTGPGVAEEVMSHIFEPFFSTKAKGTGLGMAICHSLVTQHGGTIRVESDAGGATFMVAFPRTPPAE